MCLNLDISVATDIGCTFSRSKSRIFTIDHRDFSPNDLLLISRECMKSNNLTNALNTVHIKPIPVIDEDHIVKQFNDTINSYSWMKPLLVNPNDALNTLKTINPSFKSVSLLDSFVSDAELMDISKRLGSLDIQSVSNSIQPQIQSFKASINEGMGCRGIADDYQHVLKTMCKEVQKGLDAVYFYFFVMTLLAVLIPPLLILLNHLPESDSPKPETDFPYRPMPVYGPFS